MRFGGLGEVFLVRSALNALDHLDVRELGRKGDLDGIELVGKEYGRKTEKRQRPKRANDAFATQIPHRLW